MANERSGCRKSKEAHFGQEESDSSTFEGKSGVFRSISGSCSMTECIEVVVEEENTTEPCVFTDIWVPGDWYYHKSHTSCQYRQWFLLALSKQE